MSTIRSVLIGVVGSCSNLIYIWHCKVNPSCGPPGRAKAFLISASASFEHAKKGKIAALIKEHLDPLEAQEWRKDEHRLFSRYVTLSCEPNQIATLLLGYRGVSQRLAESLLLPLLDDPKDNRKKIRNAFAADWTCWKEFDSLQPACSFRILPYIDEEEILSDIYQIDPNMPADEKAKIVEHLTTTHFFYNQEYAMPLLQEQVDRSIK